MGEKQRCDTCTAWSQLVAHGNGSGIEAVCLNPASPDHAKFRPAWHRCAAWSNNPELADLT